MIVLLLWLYISGFIILIGAEINAVIEHSSQEGKEPGKKWRMSMKRGASKAAVIGNHQPHGLILK